MSVPAKAPVAEDGMDPADTVDFVIELAALLEDGETCREVTFVVAEHSVLLGLTVLDDPPHEPVEIADAELRIWVTVDPAMRGNPAWSGQGTVCGIEFTVTTSLDRTFERTVGIRVIQK